MAEFEELTLEVNLVDNASAQLSVLKRKFDDLGGSSQGLDKLHGQLRELDKTLKGLVESFSKGPEGLLKFATSFGAVGGSLAATALGLEKLTKNLTEFASEVVALGQLGDRLGLPTAVVKQWDEMYERHNKNRATAEAELTSM